MESVLAQAREKLDDLVKRPDRLLEPQEHFYKSVKIWARCSITEGEE